MARDRRRVSKKGVLGVGDTEKIIEARAGLGAGRLRGRVAVVTGAAGGIGFATAARLAGEGAVVVLTDRDGERVDASAERLGQEGLEVTAHELDVADAGQVEPLFEAVERRHGPVGILVNVAGIISDNPVGEMTDEQWDSVVDVNLKGAFLCCRAAQRSMVRAGRGAIVNLSSRTTFGNPGQANYSASKAGIRALTRTLAMELGPSGIRVNAITPGYVATPMADGAARDSGMDPEAHREMAAGQIFLRRVGRPEEIAAVIAFVASDEASFLTGANIDVNGGV